MLNRPIVSELARVTLIHKLVSSNNTQCTQCEIRSNWYETSLIEIKYVRDLHPNHV